MSRFNKVIFFTFFTFFTILSIVFVFEILKVKECELDNKILLDRLVVFESNPMLLSKIKKINVMCSIDNINLIVDKINEEPRKEKIYALLILSFFESKPEFINDLYVRLTLVERKNIVKEIKEISLNSRKKMPDYYWNRIKVIEEYFNK